MKVQTSIMLEYEDKAWYDEQRRLGNVPPLSEFVRDSIRKLRDELEGREGDVSGGA